MLVKHLRDGYRKPYATLVALSPSQIGLAICCPKDKFSKEMGRRIAEGRARYVNAETLSDIINQVEIPNRFISVGKNNPGVGYFFMDVVRPEVQKMMERAKRYFKSEPNV